MLRPANLKHSVEAVIGYVFCHFIQDGDKLRWVDVCTEKSSVIVASSCGRAVHFSTDEHELRALSHRSSGIKVSPFSSLNFECI